MVFTGALAWIDPDCFTEQIPWQGQSSLFGRPRSCRQNWQEGSRIPTGSLRGQTQDQNSDYPGHLGYW